MTRPAIGWIARVTLAFFILMVAALALIWLFLAIVAALPRKLGV